MILKGFPALLLVFTFYISLTQATPKGTAAPDESSRLSKTKIYSLSRVEAESRKAKRSKSFSSSSSSKKTAKKVSHTLTKGKVIGGDDKDDPETSCEDGDCESAACFPASASVPTEDGRTLRMDELAVGDSVLSGPNGQFSRIFMFTHKAPEVRARFFRFLTDAGHRIACTPGHYLVVNGGMKAARSVQVGDMMVAGDGSEEMVTSVVKNVVGEGLFNPMTTSGQIVVYDDSGITDESGELGLLASTYTTAVEPATGHVLLTPLRFVFEWCGIDMSAGSLEGGAPVDGIDALFPSGSTHA
eukprot:Plantae.Rhodophyta-Palmaria_palmata.ctg5194.p1 GENE.Plantae.Rhodophyta-Palmaria_palmata.ctg5194~~Plantae.Rhodophyta-Palmaria_palmata.ctg5194.p1  ORF type:complete len:300 (+),score=35.32 Plantae.Rhodophyta-Palmaria_palmata.ctg5194:86-985(+)